MSRGLCRIELVDFAFRHRLHAAARPQIVRLHIGIGGQELDFTPRPPAALMAPVGLPIRKFLTEPFKTVPKSRWVDPSRRAPRAFHEQPLEEGVILTQRHPGRSARDAGLIYSTDAVPGIRRIGRPNRFRYILPSGRPASARDIARIKALVIPPAWTHVWICPNPRGHLQATGRDARGRKQYRYHAKWRHVRDETKYGRMSVFGRLLPAIRRRLAHDLRRAGLPREKVLAAVVKLLETTFIRVGNDEYARQNRSYGLTTLRDGHVRVSGSKVRFIFRGKSGVEHSLELDDPRLARIVKQCRDLPGQELFQYRDGSGAVVDVGSADVNAYLKEISGTDFTSKDFRTWAGTVLAARLLCACEPCRSEREGKRAIVQAIDEVAKRLGNTRAVCRKCYVHPAVLDAYLDGTIGRVMRKPTESEQAILRLLERKGRGATGRRSRSRR